MRLRKRRHALLKNAPEYSFSNTTWNSSMKMCVRLPRAVVRHAVEHRVGDDEQPHGLELAAQVHDVVDEEPVAGLTLVGCANASSVPR